MSVTQLHVKKHMIFSSGKELFACPLSQVKEVVGFHKLTLVPTSPRALRGLINLRGKVLPVFDFAEKAGCQKKEDETKRPCILIAELNRQIFGLLVDDVIEVVSVHEEQIEKKDLSEGTETRGFEGVLKMPDHPLILLVSFEGLFLNENIPNYSNENNKAA